MQVKSIAECSEHSAILLTFIKLPMQVKSIAECSEHSAILLTIIKLPIVIKIFVLSIFEWLFYTGVTVFGSFCLIV